MFQDQQLGMEFIKLNYIYVNSMHAYLLFAVVDDPIFPNDYVYIYY